MEWCDVFCDLLQYTCTEKCNLFVLYNKNSNGLLKDFGAWKKKNKSADVIWRGFDVICMCVCPLIDDGTTTNENAHSSHVIV